MDQSKAGVPRFDHIGFRNYGQMLAKRSPLKRSLIGRLFPFHVYHTVREELRLARMRLRAGTVRRRFQGQHELLVNVGAGRRGRDGWVNVDSTGYPGVDCIYDCRKSLPFSDGSVRGIFSEHFLEHIDYTEEVPVFLTECRRVLQPGGVLRVIVPDAELYLRAYVEDGWTSLEKVRGLEAGHRDHYYPNAYVTKMELVNQVFRQGYEHKYAYDWHTLQHAMQTFGFPRVIRQEFGQSELPELALDRQVRRSESLYVEAIKE